MDNLPYYIGYKQDLGTGNMESSGYSLGVDEYYIRPYFYVYYKLETCFYNIGSYACTAAYCNKVSKIYYK